MGKSCSKVKQKAETPSKKKREWKIKKSESGTKNSVKISCKGRTKFSYDILTEQPYVSYGTAKETSPEKRLDDIRTTEIASQPRVQPPAGLVPPPPDVKAETPSKKKREQKKRKSDNDLENRFKKISVTENSFSRPLDDDDYPEVCSFARIDYVRDDENYNPYVSYGSGQKTSSEKHLDDIRTTEIVPQPRVQHPAGPAPPPPDLIDN